mmetsp:Transcript_34818/g.104118  ORF Transcript_34818/g.104118 Transcript_34818/m.104118 type:complete len:205 (+) Transcript_34818:162-776(+)
MRAAPLDSLSPNPPLAPRSVTLPKLEFGLVILLNDGHLLLLARRCRLVLLLLLQFRLGQGLGREGLLPALILCLGCCQVCHNFEVLKLLLLLLSRGLPASSFGFLLGLLVFLLGFRLLCLDLLLPLLGRVLLSLALVLLIVILSVFAALLLWAVFGVLVHLALDGHLLELALLLRDHGGLDLLRPLDLLLLVILLVLERRKDIL